MSGGDFLGLPRWLREPLIISNDLEDLDSKFIESSVLNRLGLSGLYAFQSRVRQLLLSNPSEGPRDLCVSAPTGSGKTLAYVIPVVEELRVRVVSRLRALVVVPTRDLVPQVEGTFKSVVEAMEADLRVGVDYLVVTPGRLIDLLLSDLDMSALRYLVVDEADRLLDQSFQEWLPRLLERIHKTFSTDECEFVESQTWDRRVQKLLFSATLTTDPAKIAPLQLNRPLYVKVSAGAATCTPASLKETVVVFGGEEEMKPAVLAEVMDRLVGEGQVLCFTKSVMHAQRLAALLPRLCPSIRVAAFHGDLNPRDRQLLLDGFSNGGLQVLVGSDAMARGLDLIGVGWVINYDMPTVGSTYIHRVGRTARAGAQGHAVTILPASQTRHFKSMLRSELGKRVVEVEESVAGEGLVGKIEIDGELLETKWRQKLNDALTKK